MVYEASFSGILKIIFWLLIISFVIRLVARMALPHVVNKAREQMNDELRRRQEAGRPARPEGHVTIESSKSAGNSKGDDYVDFVELKD